MRRLGIAMAVIALSVAGVATAAHATETLGLGTPVAVTPARGTPTTTFTIRFTTPVATGSLQGLRAWEIVSVADRNHSSPSCAGATARQLPPAVAHHQVSVRFSAAAQHWCTGAYAGTITLYRSIICDPGPASRHMECPEIAFPPEPIGHFRFTVARPAS
jgi:hypothetical protein